jgi:HEAT repeat protein/cyclophilin family peptidyl-prolyl cis-trans isomerase
VRAGVTAGPGPRPSGGSGRRPRRGAAVAGVSAFFLALAFLAAPAEEAPRTSPTSAPAPVHHSGTVRNILDREAARDTTGLGGWLLTAPTPEVRGAAAAALGRIGARGSRRALEAALWDKVASVRARAAFALGLLGDSAASAAFVRRLPREKDPAARDAMITALGYLGSRRDGSPEIAKSLHAKRLSERWAAALAAARTGDPALSGPLATHADEKSSAMRWRVAYALGRVRNPAGAEALRRLAKDPVEIVRYHAARALGEVEDPGSARLLIGLLSDPAWRVRVNAAHALGALGAREAGPALVVALKDRNAEVRWEAALSLGAIRDSSAVPALTKALGDSASGVVQGAALALLRIRGGPAVPVIAPYLDLLPPFLRSGLMEALGRVPGSMALETLIARARDISDPAEAAGAASGLGERSADSAAAAPVLVTLLSAKDFTVAASAAEALGTLRDSSAVSALAALLHRSGTPQDADVRASAAEALASIGTREALEALSTARRDPERRTRETACAALGLPPDSAGVAGPSTMRVDPPYTGPKRTAVVRTERGTIEFTLDAAAAPRTVENFIRLARSGFFDGITFHRVVPNFVIQAGCPRGDGWGGPGYEIPCEVSDRPYRTGTVGMALAGKDTGGSQWFITLSPQPRLEGRYAVLGEVVSGLGVVERIMPGDRILKVTIR